ncbi:MAG: hypothetical protein L6243_07565 [Candidatus Altiarchaeales archaeon]|nr:hypothetical protein [Candidatus Altiarchaeota archaeon]MBU4341687.1 hypothetical protein [Candidatus Altiarchaeota archaeon]MBU4406273.1 hypothetical protein [Candidatus Altiarchaeota archaeon]MBU4437291.1 hypothetical protein [Candidatus Altiarchaeota archaeon]MCG2783428.1 hypothetical protein [Candidatus Altiarchaeales archaeon]
MLKAFKKLETNHQKLFALIIGVAVIMFWRGIWGLLDVYFLPNDVGLSLVLSAVIGLVILAACDVVIKELV